MSALGHQLHHRLEEVHVEAVELIDAIQPGVVAVVAYQSPHHCPVLLLYMTTIILFVGARAGKCDPLPNAISIEVLVNELTTIVRVQPQQGEGQTLLHSVHCSPYTLLAFSPYPNTL